MDPVTPPTPVIVGGFPFRRRRPKSKSLAAAAAPPPAEPTTPRSISPAAPADPAPPLPLRSRRRSVASIAAEAPPLDTTTPAAAEAPPGGDTATGPPSPAKRRKLPTKAYAAVPPGECEETRYRMLVESFLQRAHAAAALAEPPTSADDLRSLMQAVVDGVEAAGECERAAEGDRIAARTRPSADDAAMVRRAAQLEYVVQEYGAELSQWKLLEEDLPALAAGTAGARSGDPGGVHILPPIPALDSLTGVEALEGTPPAVDAVESFVLHADRMNHALRRLEAQHDEATEFVAAVTDVLNASVFDGGLLDLTVSKIVASPSPAHRGRSRR